MSSFSLSSCFVCVQSTSLEAGPTPPFYLDKLIGFVPGVLFDSAPWGQDFGDVLIQPNPVYYLVSNSHESGSCVCLWGQLLALPLLLLLAPRNISNLISLNTAAKCVLINVCTQSNKTTSLVVVFDTVHLPDSLAARYVLDGT